MINIRNFFQALPVLMIVLLASACATTLKADQAGSQDIFHHPADVVHQAAINALISTGFNIGKKDQDYIQGARPLKPGLIVSSGGETVGVWINSITPNKTQVKVHTTKSFIGYAGQKDWGNEILYKITREVSEK